MNSVSKHVWKAEKKDLRHSEYINKLKRLFLKQGQKPVCFDLKAGLHQGV